MVLTPVMADLRGPVLSSKGGHQNGNNGGALVKTCENPSALKNEGISGEFISILANTNPHDAEVKLAGVKHGGRGDDKTQVGVGLEEYIAVKNLPGSAADDFVATLEASGMENVEWIKTTVDSLGRIVYDAGGLPQEGVSLQEDDLTSKAGGGVLGFDGEGPSSSGTSIMVAKTEPHQVLVLENSPDLVSSVDTNMSAFDSAVTSVWETTSKSLFQMPTFTVTETGLEKLSSADRACLEEIERGSQLTPEEKELLENSRKEMQAMDFQDLEQDRNGLLTTQDLVSIPDQALGFEGSDSQNPKTSFSNFVIQNIPSTISDNTNIVAKAASASQILSSQSIFPEQSGTETPMIHENQPVWAPSTAISASTQSSIDQPIVTDQTCTMTDTSNLQALQIFLYDDQGKQQIITIDQKTVSDSLQKMFTEVDKEDKTGLAEKKPGPLVCSLSDISVTQDGYLVIPVDANAVENMPASIDHQEPVVQATNKSGKGSLVEKQWMCSLCGQVFQRLSKLKVHIMTHTGERPFKCTVDGCKWQFTSAHKLKRHMECHEKRKDFVCNIEGCGKKFTTIYNLRTHHKWHERPPSEFCTYEGCEEGFQNKKLLDKHLKEVHGETNSTREKNYVCPHPGCGRRFAASTCMGSHKRVHEKNLDLTCHYEGCGRTFDKLCRLQQHQLSHTGERPFKCEFEGCKWAFASSSKLRRHMNKHNNQRKYICPEEGCGKRFLRAEHLKGHLITHTGQKPFECPLPNCTARFSSKSSMYVHAKRHKQASMAQAMLAEDGDLSEGQDGPRAIKIQYYCPVDTCNKKFNYKSSLKTHIDRHYQEQFKNALSVLPVLNMSDIENIKLVGSGSQAASAIGTSGNTITVGQSLLAAPADASAASSVSDSMLPAGTMQSILPLRTGASTSVAGGMISVPIVLTPELAQLRQDVVSVGGLSLSATMGIGALASSGIGSSRLDLGQAGSCVSTLSGSQPGTSPGHGAARTDSYTNQMLCDKAKRRRQLLREKANSVDYPGVDDVQGPSSKQQLSYSSKPSDVTMVTQTVNPNEIMTSRAITFRDPETGAILIQTQLLQDDPPNPDVYSEDSSVMPPLADPTDLASILGDPHSADTGGSEFTSTTINLQDLE